jgi:hypothetical protein
LLSSRNWNFSSSCSAWAAGYCFLDWYLLAKEMVGSHTRQKMGMLSGI